MHALLTDIARIGLGIIYLFTVVLDFKMRASLFKLMKLKKVPLPWFFFIGAVTWVSLSSLALILDFHTFWAALLLSLYIFVANLIFNNFWAQPKNQRDFALVMFVTNLAVSFGLLGVA